MRIVNKSKRHIFNKNIETSDLKRLPSVKSLDSKRLHS